MRKIAIVTVLAVQLFSLVLSITTVSVTIEQDTVYDYLGGGNKNFFVIVGLFTVILCTANIIDLIRLVRNGRTYELVSFEYLLGIAGFFIALGWLFISFATFSKFPEQHICYVINMMTGFSILASLVTYHAFRFYIRSTIYGYSEI